ncbi:MAG: helix-turn-helix transcriptional regulator [Clostridia bacterium]|nr:helix-turn-helix transcriptional regulator [Clostridia bacterium]
MDILNNIVVTEICDLFTVQSVAGKYEHINNRYSYGLCFCKGGQITYTHKGINYISNESCAIILPQGESYTLKRDKSGIFPIINFKTATPLCNRHICIPVDNQNSYIKNFEQMKTLFLFERNRAKVMSIFYDILDRLSNSLNDNTPILQNAVRCIESNYQNNNFNNATLASQCNISEVYLRKLFINKLNTSPKQYIINLRIGKAKQLLRDGILKISVISEECGFSNQYHFSRLFKDKVGMTPSEYMRSNRNNLI